MTALATPAAVSRGQPAPGGADRAIRVSTAVVVVAVASIAAYISYWHAYAVVREYGENGVTARLEPATHVQLARAEAKLHETAMRKSPCF